MKFKAGKILVPTLIVGLAALQSFGIDAGRALRYSREGVLWQGWRNADSTETKIDTLETRDSLAVQTDSLSRAVDSLGTQLDSLTAALDSLAGRDSLGRTDSTAVSDSLAARDSVKETIPRPSPDEIEKRLREQIDSLRTVRNGIIAEIDGLNDAIYSLSGRKSLDSLTDLKSDIIAHRESLRADRDSLNGISKKLSAEKDALMARDSLSTETELADRDSLAAETSADTTLAADSIRMAKIDSLKADAAIRITEIDSLKADAAIQIAKTDSLEADADLRIAKTDSLITVQTSASPDSGRTAQIDSLSARIDSLAVIRDSLANIESVYFANDTIYLRDTIGFIRDTVLVPSRLKKNDPFKYKYYPALRDSATRAHKRDSLLAAQDSMELHLLDSLYIKDSIDIERSKPPIMARDTIVVPDSLQYTDPFKYKYYIAIRDPLTRQEVRDSLLAAQDTLELFKLDSLYTKDSTEIADAEFLAWYSLLTKKERKKYDLEQLFQIKLAEVNAKVAHKDSIKFIKDSIMEATPRILETYAIPDSMQYKRIIMWRHDRSFNDVNLEKMDTSYNFHFHDTPPLQKDIATTDLGISGSASQAFNYFRRAATQDVFFYDAYSDYTYSADNLPMYNTKTSYTELAYWGTLLGKSEKEETNIRVFTTQNILPSLNITLEYNRFGGEGMMQNESTDNRTFVAAGNYLGKRYLLHTGYIYNKASRTENGGMTDNMWIRDTTVDAKEIPVNLSNAKSKIKQNTIFLDQSYRIPFNFIRNIQNGVYKQRRADRAALDSLTAIGDSAGVEALLLKIAENIKEKVDSIDRNVTSAFIGHSTEYSVYTRNYSDNISSGGSESDFYNNNFYINPSETTDSMRVMRFENRVYIRVQPWKADGIVSKLDVGIGDKLLNYYDYDRYNYIKKKNNVSLNSLYLYAGVRGQYKNMFSWDATGDYTFLGHELNDFGIKANIEFNWYPFRRDRHSPLTIQAHFETSMREPDYYQQKIFTNHYRWDNNFGKISTTKAWGRLLIPRWQLEAEFDYALLNNNIYYDNSGMIHQNGSAMSVMTASLTKNFKLWWLHFDHRALFQVSSNDEVLPLPMLTLNFRYYLQMDVVKNVMQMQLGADARWFTKWYMQGYNPALGVFYNQNEEKYGNCPFIDVFLNIQWKRTCIFIKGVNIGQGWPKSNVDYFSAHHYIHSQMAIKFGVFWPFYIQPAKNRGLAAKAAAGAAIK